MRYRLHILLIQTNLNYMKPRQLKYIIKNSGDWKNMSPTLHKVLHHEAYFGFK